MTHNALRLGRRSLFCGTALLTLASVTSMAYAQSNPGFVYGQVPTPAQWNSYFSAKLDVSNPQITGSMGFTSNQVYNSPTITVPPITNYVETISGTIGGGLSAPRVPNPFINQQTITNGVTLNNSGGIYGWHWKESLNKATGSNSVALFELSQVNTTPADNGRTSSFEAAGFYVTMVAPAGGTLPAQTFANGFVYGINTKPFLSDGALNYSLLNGLGEVDLGISPVYNTITVVGSVTIGETDTIELASTNCGFPGGVILTATAASGDTPGIVLNKFFAQILANDTLSACGVGGAMAGATSTSSNTLEITSPPNNLTGVVDLAITFPPPSGGSSLTYTLAPVTTIGASAQTKVGMTIVELKKDGVAGAASNSVFGIAKQSGGAFPPTSGGWDNLITFIGTTNEFAPDDMTVVPGQWPLDRLFNGVIANIPTQYSGQNDTPLQFPRMSSWEDLPNVDFLLSDITTGLGPLVYPGFMLKGDGSEWIGAGTIQRLVGNAGTVGIQIQANGWEGTAVALSNGGGPGAGTLTGRYYINDITTCGFGDHEMVDTITAAGGIATFHVINDGTRFEYPSSGPGSAPSATCHPLGGSGAGAVYTITWSAGNTVTVGNSGGTVNLLGVVNGSIAPSLVQATNGLNARTLGNWFGDSVNVLGQNVTGNGSTNDAATLLTASNLAQSSGNVLFLPTPSGSYLLNSDWKPAVGDLSVFISPGVTFTGAGLPKLDNQFPHYAYPIFASISNTRTYGSFYNPYTNVDLDMDIAVNTGTANVVAIQGVGVSTTSTSPTWGGDFVCVQEAASGKSCNVMELDTINNVSLGNAYGLVVVAQGSFNSNTGITIGGTTSGVQWTNALVFQGTSIGNLAPATNAFIETTAFTGSVGKGMYMRGVYSNFEMSWPSFYVGPTPGTTTARVGITGGSGTGAAIAVVPNDGGSTANELLSIASLGNAVVNIGNGDGIGFQVKDGGASTINYGYVTPGISGASVTYGCGFSGDANVNCIISPRGTGTLTVQNTGGGPSAQFTAAASSNTRINFTAGVSGAAPIISEGGTAANLAISAGANTIQFSGAGTWTANGTTAVTLTALGPAGASTTVKKWLTFVDNTGATCYIPVY